MSSRPFVAWMDFLEIFKKVQTCSNLERDIFGFLKKYFFGRIAKKAKNEPIFDIYFFVKTGPKAGIEIFSKKFYFLPTI